LLYNVLLTQKITTDIARLQNRPGFFGALCINVFELTELVMLKMPLFGII